MPGQIQMQPEDLGPEAQVGCAEGADQRPVREVRRSNRLLAAIEEGRATGSDLEKLFLLP